MITVPINIELEDLQNEFNMTNDQVLEFIDDVVGRIAVLFASTLEQEAQKELHRSRQRYIRAIKLFNEGHGHKAVILDMSDKFVQMLEEGAAPFDMKPGFLASPKVKFSQKTGLPYLTIPFRWATPGAIGESELFSFKMPRPVYNVVKKKDVVIPVSGGGLSSQPLKIQEVPKQYRVQTSRDVILATSGEVLFDEYLHKSNIYEGIAKYNDPVTNQNVYRSFRRVSANSDPLSWIHPGIKQHNLFGAALDKMDINMENELNVAVDNALIKLGFS